MATCWLLEDRLWTKHLEKGPVQVLGAEFSKCLEVFCLSSWRPALISVSCGAHDQRLDVIFHNSIMVGKDKVEACMRGVQYARFAMDRLREMQELLATCRAQDISVVNQCDCREPLRSLRSPMSCLSTMPAMPQKLARCSSSQTTVAPAHSDGESLEGTCSSRLPSPLPNTPEYGPQVFHECIHQEHIHRCG